MQRWSHALALVPLFFILSACDDSTDPTEVGLDAFIGTYAIEPSLTMTCDLGDFGDVAITVDTVDVTDASADSLFLRLPLAISTSLFGEHDAEAEFAVAVTGDDGFAGESPLEVSVPAGVTTVTGDGNMVIDGEFTGDDSFTAQINGELSIQVGSGTPTDCTPPAGLVEGTRVE